MHEQLRLAKSPFPPGEKNPGASYLEYLENDFLANQFDLLEAYRRHSNPKAAFQAFHMRALMEHDWQAAAELRTAHAAALPNDPQLLAAESASALQQGDYDRVIELLQPWPAAERFENEWTRQQARDACVISLIRRQRLDEALAVAKDAGTNAPQLVALVHLVRGDAEALAAWLKQHRLSQPSLLVHIADSYRREFIQARQNGNLVELLKDIADYPHDDFTSSIVLLSGEGQPASIDTLRTRLAEAIPGTQLGEPIEHDTGISYVLTIPGTEQVQFQLTVGKGPYATDAELREQYVLPVRLRKAVQEHKTWLALEMTEPEPTSAADGPWKQVRQLAATLCDERTLAVGRSEPHVYHCEYVVASPRLPELLRSAGNLRRSLAEEVSAYVAFAGESQALQPPAVKQQAKLWLRKLKAGETVTGEVRITAKRGHRRESTWLRVVAAQQGQYGPHQFVAEPPANHPLLPAKRYRLWPHEIREVRSTAP